jgi:glucose-1-phosphate cytidylyltransferase
VLASQERLAAYPYDGFWMSLDTLKDLEVLQRLEARDSAPWAVWRRPAEPAPGA